MIAKSYYNLTNIERNNFIEFLKQASIETTQPAHVNMYDINWNNKPNTLMYILENTERFKINGFYQILFDGDKVIASGGVYASEFSKDIAILGTRTWIHKDHRHKLISREYLLPNEKKWAIERGFKAIALTFNQYNKNLIKLWHRSRLGESRSIREHRHFGFNGVTEIEFPVTIQFTKQWIIYEKLDEDFYFDWKILQHKEGN
jgi:hypothetical protein